MFPRTRILAGASAVVLAAGAGLGGAAVAAAQDDDDTASTGSLSSSSLDFGEIAGDLESAARALNSPVTVTPNAEGGPTITYVNETGGAQNCLGFTAPYSTVIEEDLDTNYDPDDLAAALALVNALEDGGDISVLTGDDDGAPIASTDPNPETPGDVQGMLVGLILGTAPGAATVADGATATWTTPLPASPALAVLACLPDGEGEFETYTGIDPQVVADQINSRIPGGSLEIVSPDMISGGSVETGVTVLGSLDSASAAGDDDGGDGDGGDDDDNNTDPAEG